VLQVYNEYVKLRSSRDSMTTGPSASAATNPDLQRLDGLITSSSRQLLSAVKSQIEAIDARIAALDGLSSRSAAEVSALPQTEAEEARLMQDMDGTQKMTDQLREEQQRARISEVAQVGQVQIIDLARGPGAPINGGDSRKVIFAALLGLALGVGLTLLLDSFDTSLRRISDAERILRLPILGAIPELSGAKPKKRRLRLPSVRLSDVQANQSRPAEPAETKRSVPIKYVNPSTPAFESFRALRTSLIFSNAVKSLRSIVVTSAAAGDGKSTTSTNLAAAFAQQGMRVLVIDCDLRRGRLHAAFHVPRSPGLTEVIVGASTVAEAVHETEVPNMFLLTAGKQPPNPTELLGSEPVRNILMQLMTEYDLLIIDTPPVLAAADAAVLSAIVDGSIMVVRVGVTDRRAAKRSLERLQVVGGRVLGTVLNDPQEILGTSEDYYYYQYRYADKKVAS
jgi:capsular exopolysaccharide synthesis family protein